MKKPRLPSSTSNVWPGGFVFDEARYVAHVATGGGTVVAAGNQGCVGGAAVFGVTHEKGRSGILRIDAQGNAMRIGEIEGAEDPGPRIWGFAWDASRHTLWSAAGDAGLVHSTAPGAKPPFGAGALS
jgi:hypothetical protein